MSGEKCHLQEAREQAQEAAAKALAQTGGACLDGSCDTPPVDGPGTAALKAGDCKTGHCR